MIGPAFLMCPPDFYDVAYEINPWMSVKHKADKEKARKQWEAYYALLTKELKVRVELLEPVKGLPDLVFTANGGLVKNTSSKHLSGPFVLKGRETRFS